MTIKDFAKEKENNMENFYDYDSTLKKQENKDKSCDNVKYIFVSKDNRELIYGNKNGVTDFLWNKADVYDILNEQEDIEDFDIYKITGNVEKVPLKKIVKFSI